MLSDLPGFLMSRFGPQVLWVFLIKSLTLPRDDYDYNVFKTVFTLCDKIHLIRMPYGVEARMSRFFVWILVCSQVEYVKRHLNCLLFWFVSFHNASEA